MSGMLDGLLNSSGMLATFGITAGGAALALAAGGTAASLYGATQAGKGGGGGVPAPVNIFAQKTIKAVKGKKASRGKPAVAAQPARLADSLATQQAKGLTSYYGEQVPGFLELSKRFGPELMGQMFGQTSQFLGGVGGQPGFNALQLSSGQEAGRTIGQLRAEELGQMTGQAGLTRGLMQALSPEQAAAVAQASKTAAQAQGLEADFVGRTSQMGQTMAQEAFNRRGALSPEEQRLAQQQARAASAASGRIGGNAAIAAEIQNREAAQAARRSEASRLGQIGFGQTMDIEQQRARLREEAAGAGLGAFNMANLFYTQPGLAALQNAPLSYSAGGKNLGIAMTAGPESSGSFDYNMPLNMAMSQGGAQNEAAMANAQIQAAKSAAKAQAFSSLGQGLTSLGMTSMMLNAGSTANAGGSGKGYLSGIGGIGPTDTPSQYTRVY